MCTNCRNDSCACRPCTYPNGAVALIVAQIFFLVAFLMSFFAAGDCKFLLVPEAQVGDRLDAILDNTTDAGAAGTDSAAGGTDNEGTKRGLGLFFFEDAAGACTWEDRDFDERTFDAYWDHVGRSDWEDASEAAVAVTVLGFCALVWSLLFACLAHPRIVRFIFAAVVLVVLTILQGVSFLLLRSDFCNAHDCSLGRSGHYGIAAVFFYFFAGLALLFTKDHPRGGARSPEPIQTYTQTYPPGDAAAAAAGKDGENATHAVEEHNTDEEEASAPVEESSSSGAIPAGAEEEVQAEEGSGRSDVNVSSAVDSQATTVQAQNAY